ncbi:MAG TPA: cupin domain-containing protein [Dehalococcoidia bacterium]|nr:cupin domain-containing protein [Dehalococcoidia bacterium]
MTHADRQIVNRRTGQTMIFRRTAQDTAGQLLQIECSHEPHGPREIEHIHPYQESRFEILGGRLGFQIAGSERSAGPGDVVTIPPNTPHHFWNAGAEVADYLQEFRPALCSEQYFRALFSLARAGKLDQRGMPSPLALAVLVPAFGDTIRPCSPPWPLLRGLAWLLGPLARLRGYRRESPDGAAAPSPRQPAASTGPSLHD